MLERIDLSQEYETLDGMQVKLFAIMSRDDKNQFNVYGAILRPHGWDANQWNTHGETDITNMPYMSLKLKPSDMSFDEALDFMEANPTKLVCEKGVPTIRYFGISGIVILAKYVATNYSKSMRFREIQKEEV